MREVIQQSGTVTPEVRKAKMDQYIDAETERWTTVRELLKEEVTRVDPRDRAKLRRLMGPEKTMKLAQLILERAAEPSHGLTPDDLSMLKKAFLHVASKSEKGLTYMRMGGYAIGAGVLYYVYNIMNWSP